MKSILRRCVIFSMAVSMYLSANTTDVQALEVADGYVCAVRFRPSTTSPSFGDYGYIWLQVSEKPDCAGALTNKYIYSVGATSPVVDNASYLYDGTEMSALTQVLWQSVFEDQKIFVYYSDTTNQIYFVNPLNE